MKRNDECPQNCPGRSATCHATCEKHLAGWKERRREDARAHEQNIIADYTAKEILKVKSGRYSNLARYRPKERRRG